MATNTAIAASTVLLVLRPDLLEKRIFGAPPGELIIIVARCAARLDRGKLVGLAQFNVYSLI